MSIVGEVKRRFLAPDIVRRRMRPALAFAFAGSAFRAPLDARPRPSAVLVRTAEDWRALLPPDDELKAALLLFEEAIEAQAKPLEIVAVGAWLVDAAANRRTDGGEVFIETLELLLEHADEPLSAAVIAAAAWKTIEDSSFLPSPSEMLKAALSMRRTFDGARRRAEHLLELRESATDVLWFAGRLSRAEYGLPVHEGASDDPPF